MGPYLFAYMMFGTVFAIWALLAPHGALQQALEDVSPSERKASPTWAAFALTIVALVLAALWPVIGVVAVVHRLIYVFFKGRFLK
jgi:hypothetical protein